MSESLSSAVAALTASQRELLCERWTHAALAEHASIGSFSRFALHLLAVGAPSQLVADAHRAALDEIEHARMCFGLASVYAGEPLGPGPLPLDGDLLGLLSLAPITAAAVVEGCVGETVAALEASAAAERTTVPEIHATLETISADESRHAQLAWRFVRWALQQSDPTVRPAVQAAFRQALAARPLEAECTPDDAILEAHGRLSGPALRRCQQAALRDVVAPAAEALLTGV